MCTEFLAWPRHAECVCEEHWAHAGPRGLPPISKDCSQNTLGLAVGYVSAAVPLSQRNSTNGTARLVCPNTSSASLTSLVPVVTLIGTFNWVLQPSAMEVQHAIPPAWTMHPKECTYPDHSVWQAP